MAIIPNARTITLPNSMTDPKALVACKDELGVATMGTDFIFDALNPACYLGGTLPSVGAAIPNSGILGAIITAGGSGGTDGTFALGISGGGGSGAVGTFTVTGGTVTDITMTNPGSGYTSNPTFSFSASAGLTGVTTTRQLASLLNLARDVQPALSRTKPVGLFPLGYAAKPVFDGKGIVFDNGTTIALQMAKAGLLPGKVCEPYHEGFVDTFVAISFTAQSYPVSSLGLFRGSDFGVQFATSGVPQARETGGALGAACPDGKVVTVGKLVRFNVGADTSTMTGYVAVDGQVSVTSGIAGKAPSAFTTGTSGITVIGGSSGSAAASFDGKLHYLYRELVGVSERTDAEVLAAVQAIHDASLARYS